MIQFGQQLYELTDRDVSTVLVEPWRADFTGDWGGALFRVAINQTLPRDRLLYLDTITWAITSGTGQLRDVRLTWQAEGGGPAYRIFSKFGDALNSAGSSHGDTAYPSILLPRGGLVQLYFERNNNTVEGSIACALSGYIIPAGNVARGS